MKIQLQISVNDGPAIVAGFVEEYAAAVTSVSATNRPDRGLEVDVNTGGMVRDSEIMVTWQKLDLQVGDEIKIKVVENMPITEPIEKKEFKAGSA